MEDFARRSEEFYRTLIERVSNNLIVLDQNANLIYENVNAERILGYKPGEINGKNIFSIVHPDDIKKIKDIFQQLLSSRQGIIFNTRFRAMHKNGNIRYMEVQAENLLSDPNVSGIVINYKDISELIEKTELLELMQYSIEHASVAAMWIDNEQNILLVNDACIKLTGYSREELLKKKANDLNVKDNSGYWPQLRDEIRDRGSYVFKKDILKKNGEVFPAEININYLSFRGREIFFCHFTDIIDRQIAEQAINEREKRLKIIIDSSNDPVFVVDLMGWIIEVNQQSCNDLGYSREELLGMNLSDINTPEFTSLIVERINLIRKNGSLKFDAALRKRNGDVMPVEVNTRLIDFDGRQAILSLVRDITDRVCTENELRNKEAMHRELVENMSSGVAVYKGNDDGTDFIFVGFNTAAERIEKIKREDVLGKSVLKVFPGVREFGIFDVFQRVYRTGVPEYFPIGLYRDKRIEGWRENHIYKLPSGEIVAIYDDITDRKKSEELIESLSRFPAEDPNPVLRLSDEGIILYANQASEKLLLSWNRKVGQKLGEMWNSVIKDAIKTGNTEYFDMEVAGRFFSFTVAPVTKKQYVNLYGSDITEIKLAEMELRDSKEKLRNLSSYLVAIREEERSRIAREVHDELGQTLTALNMELELLNLGFSNKQKSQRDRINGMRKLVDDSIESVEKLCIRLRPRILDDLGIIEAIEWLSKDFSRRSGIQCDVVLNAGQIHLEENISTMIFRIIQETLTNIARHSRATHAGVKLYMKSDSIEIKIIDNGVGIMPKQIASSNSIGLIGIRERVNSLNGSILIEGRRGKGTKIEINIPYKERA